MRSLPADPGFWLVFGFIALSLGMVIGFGVAARSKLVATVGLIWAGLTGLLGYSGWLSNFSGLPPRIMLIFLPTIAGVAYLAFSRFGKRLSHFSLNFLVGFQSFRIIVEILIHQAAEAGVAPVQMSWTGLNFDIVTGVTALLLFPFAAKLPKWVLHIWNFMGFGLLALVVTVAILSMPTPFQQLQPDNVWVAFFPFIWLPTILVAFALLGHLVLFRKLALEDS